MITQNPAHASYLSLDKAIKTAKQLNNDDADWYYEIELRGKFAVIAVYDEDAKLLGYL
jgi:hypothetical protein